MIGKIEERLAVVMPREQTGVRPQHITVILRWFEELKERVT